MKLSSDITKLNWDIIKSYYSFDIHGFDYIPIGFGSGIYNKEVVVYEIE